MHHPVAPAPDYETGRPLPGRRRILDALEDMGVEMVMGGHLHRAFISHSKDVHPRETRNRGILVVQSGTTTSRRGRGRERGRQSFNLIRIGAAATEVQHFLYFAAEGCFSPVSAHVLPRGEARFLSPEEATQTTGFLSGDLG
jgi:hypothetical protein